MEELYFDLESEHIRYELSKREEEKEKTKEEIRGIAILEDGEWKDFINS